MGTDSAVIDPVQPAANDWRPHLTDEMRADPVVAGWAEKASEKDVASLVKGYAHLSKKMGSAVNIPGKDAKPEDVTAFKTKLIEAGVLPAPIKDPKDYAITKPEGLPEGLQWSDELSTKLATALHKHQIPKEAVADLMALHLEAMGGVGQAVTFDREQALAAIRGEHGEKYDERVEMVKRMIPGVFSQESMDFFAQTGIDSDPRFISALMRLAPLAMQDSSFMESVPRAAGEISGKAAQAEYADIISNPKNERHEGWKKSDPKVMQYIDELYRKAYPGNVLEQGKALVATA